MLEREVLRLSSFASVGAVAFVAGARGAPGRVRAADPVAKRAAPRADDAAAVAAVA